MARSQLKIMPHHAFNVDHDVVNTSRRRNATNQQMLHNRRFTVSNMGIKDSKQCVSLVKVTVAFAVLIYF